MPALGAISKSSDKESGLSYWAKRDFEFSQMGISSASLVHDGSYKFKTQGNCLVLDDGIRLNVHHAELDWGILKFDFNGNIHEAVRVRAQLRLKFTTCESPSCDSNELKVYARLLHAAKFHPATCSEQIPEFALEGTGEPIKRRYLPSFASLQVELDWTWARTCIVQIIRILHHDMNSKWKVPARRRKPVEWREVYTRYYGPTLSPPDWLTPQVDHGSHGSSRPWWPEVKNYPLPTPPGPRCVR